MDATKKELAETLLTMLDDYYIHTTRVSPERVIFCNEFREFLQWVAKQKTTVTPEEFAHARDNIRIGGRKNHI